MITRRAPVVTMMLRLAAASLFAPFVAAQAPLVFEGEAGPGAGKHVVFVTGDEEYRSEEGMPQLARILARLGCRCTVLFAIDPASGTIDPGVRDNIPGLEALDVADLMVLFVRFRDLPDAQMQHIVDYVNAGKPIVALRTSTHAFAPKKERAHANWAWNDTEWEGGFGRQVLGETWIAHHGAHGSQSARGVTAPGAESHPILRGITAGSVWDPADVYAVRLPLLATCTPLLLGQVLEGMTPDAAPAAPAKDEGGARDPNSPMMPLAWINAYRTPSGATARVFTTTLGSAQAFVHEGSRRLLINACLWALGREEMIAAKLDVSLDGDYAPSPFGFGTHRKNVRPADLARRSAK